MHMRKRVSQFRVKGSVIIVIGGLIGNDYIGERCEVMVGNGMSELSETGEAVDSLARRGTGSLRTCFTPVS